jgi:hypothetical protein
MGNFKLILFKNKKKNKIIKEYATEENALKKFNELLKNQNVIFEKLYEKNKTVNYELGLISKTDSFQPNLFKSDEYGRWDKVFVKNSEEYNIIKIEDYRVEETIFDYELNKKVGVEFMIDKYLNTDNLKVLSVLNNKLVIQNDDNFNVFSLKNCDESKRLLYTIEELFMSKGKNNCMFVNDESITYKKWLYEKLSNNGFDKKLLYRTKTTF